MLRPVLQEVLAEDMKASVTKKTSVFAQHLSNLRSLCSRFPQLEALPAGVLPGLVSFACSLPVALPKPKPNPSGPPTRRPIKQPPGLTSAALASLYNTLAGCSLHDQVYI